MERLRLSRWRPCTSHSLARLIVWLAGRWEDVTGASIPVYGRGLQEAPRNPFVTLLSAHFLLHFNISEISSM
jgi:hypothetical protein